MHFDITVPATWVPIVAGVIIPFVVAWLTTRNASPTVKSLLAALCAALTAVGAYLADLDHVEGWKGVVSIFIEALIVAAASRVTLTEDKVQAVQATGGVIGPKVDGV